MLCSLVPGFLVIVLANTLSTLTDDKHQNAKTGKVMGLNSSVDIRSDILRQLLNQETLIRLALERKVQSVLMEMRELETKLTSNNKQVQDEVIALQQMVHLLRTENEAMKAQLEGKSNTTALLSGIQSTPKPSTDIVAFSVYLSIKDIEISKGYTIKFDTIVTNIGSSYNRYTGVFTVPQDGVYVFTWNLYCGSDGGYFTSQLVVNSNVVGAMYTDAAGADYTNVVVVEINVGDKIYVRIHPTLSFKKKLHSSPDYRSTFSGWKLY